MPPVQGPDTADGLPAESQTGEVVDTTSITQTGGNMITMGEQTVSGLDTIAAAGMSERPALTPGEQLGDYKIEHQLGSGGMGQVFAARRVQGAEAGEFVALKYLERTSPARVRRL